MVSSVRSSSDLPESTLFNLKTYFLSIKINFYVKKCNFFLELLPKFSDFVNSEKNHIKLYQDISSFFSYKKIYIFNKKYIFLVKNREFHKISCIYDYVHLFPADDF